MAVKNQTDEAWVNNPHTQEFTVTEGGSAKNLSGLVVRWGMVQLSASGDFAVSPLVLDYSTGTGEVVIVDAPNGRVDVNIPAADTASLSPPAAGLKFYFELEVFDAGGANGVVVATGTLTLLPNLVNAA